MSGAALALGALHAWPVRWPGWGTFFAQALPVAALVGAQSPSDASGIEGLAADAALLLLVGGLAMLAFTMTLVGIQNLFPDKSAKPGIAAAPTGRSIRPLQGGGAPEHQWSALRARGEPVPPGAPADRAIIRLLQAGCGEPRLLRAHDHYSSVRVYGCPSCAGAVPGGACPEALGRIEEAFRAVFGARTAAREVRCTRRGDPACDFEVKH